ncbi:PhzF family phenazine biosynthesis isomerase [Streptomyces albofaciens JCM 4342]|uniref:PhzF family phenazine biosynthesis protein n=1 Tax=Streptomyces albofaciens TaxID=66866 RepID=UPI0012389125|nr:PhzF family phenazine biosynthesis isomerase [Streptomyces albofaciens]KAA6223979.1 PhzF family phenazine biosynthesis isomerase [Streptomyces albofaciens JCM 4342]
MEILRYSAFTDRPDGGNPAGVVLDAQGLDETDMLRIAEEVGFSETAFVTATAIPDRTHRVRYFSPRAEVDFCGHATVATAVALAERGAPGTLAFETNVGRVDVLTEAIEEIEAAEVAGAAETTGTAETTAKARTTESAETTEPAATKEPDGRGFRATLTSVPASSEPVAPQHLASALEALGWSRDDLDPAFPAHVAFAGNHHLMLAAASRERLADLDYDFEALEALSRDQNWTTVHLFHRQTDTLFHARDPFPLGGVVEDPATGAAAAAFGGYLRTIGRAAVRTPITVLQGYDMGRPSLLTVTTDASDLRVSVRGQAVVLT